MPGGPSITSIGCFTWNIADQAGGSRLTSVR